MTEVSQPQPHVFPTDAGVDFSNMPGPGSGLSGPGNLPPPPLPSGDGGASALGSPPQTPPAALATLPSPAPQRPIGDAGDGRGATPAAGASREDEELAANQARLRSGKVITIRETNGLDDHYTEDALTAAGYSLQGVGAAAYQRMMALCAVDDIDGVLQETPRTKADFREAISEFSTSDLQIINQKYSEVNLSFDQHMIDAGNFSCVTKTGKKVKVMETTGWHDQLVEESMNQAGFGLQGLGGATYTRLMALCAIDSIDGSPVTRPRTRSDMYAREKMFLSSEIQMIISLYREVNLLGGTF